MIFSDPSLVQDGLIQDCEMNIFGNYGDITNYENRLADFTSRINRAYDKAATRIMAVDGRWQWDDSNYTDFPIGSTDLVSGQQDYTLDVEFLDIVKVVIQDQASNKMVMRPIDINDPEGRRYITDIPQAGGIPSYYDKTGASLFLSPIPNYNKTGGLTVYYRRKPSYFSVGDTKKPVGIPFNFHRYLSLLASFDYAVGKRLDVKNDLIVLVKEMEEAMDDWYSKRSKDESKFIKAIKHSSR